MIRPILCRSCTIQIKTVQASSTIGPDRLESIIYDITEKKIDNPHSRSSTIMFQPVTDITG